MCVYKHIQSDDNPQSENYGGVLWSACLMAALVFGGQSELSACCRPACCRLLKLWVSDLGFPKIRCHNEVPTYKPMSTPSMGASEKQGPI